MSVVNNKKCKEGLSYLYGLNRTIVDLRKAFECFEEGVSNSSPTCCVFLGKIKKEQKNEIEAKELGIKAIELGLKTHASNGDEISLLALGFLFWWGYGVPVDDYEAIRCFQAAEKFNNPIAVNCIGYSYFHGKGVAQNYSESMRFYLRASSEYDLPHSHFNIAIMYELGLGAPVDYKKSFQLFAKAANQNDSDAQNSLGGLYERGRGVDQDYSQAIYWYQKSAEQNNPSAQVSLGIIYWMGYGVPVDFKISGEWMMRSALQNNATAQYNIGLMYFSGLGVTRDVSIAIEWFIKSSTNGDCEAKRKLSYIYRKDPDNGSSDSEKCIYWLKKASADHDDVQSQYELGLIYFSGSFDIVDKEEAKKWFFACVESHE